MKKVLYIYNVNPWRINMYCFTALHTNVYTGCQCMYVGLLEGRGRTAWIVPSCASHLVATSV